MKRSTAKPFSRRITNVPPFQKNLHSKIDPIREIIAKGLIVDSPDIGSRTLPDGRVELYLKQATAAVSSSPTPPTPPTPIPGAEGSFTEFYVSKGSGNYYNSGSTEGAAMYATVGSWNSGTLIFTPTDGSNPVSSGVAVGQFASVFNSDFSSLMYVARITAVTNAVNGAITVSSTASAGTAPATSATNRSLRVGGAWQGPQTTDAQPFNTSGIGKLQNAAGNMTRVNFKNDSTYTVTSGMTQSGPTNPVFYQGYQTTLGDGGRAVFDGQTNAIILFSTSTTHCVFADLEFKSSATSLTNDLVIIGLHAAWYRCIFHGARGGGIGGGSSASMFVECESYDCNKSNSLNRGGFFVTGAGSCLIRCYSHDHAAGTNANGFYLGAECSMVNCILDTCAGSGINCAFAGMLSVKNCDFYNNSGDGIKLATGSGNATSAMIENCNFIKNAGRGVNANGNTFATGYVFNSGYGSGSMANGTADDIGNFKKSGCFNYSSGVAPWNAQATGDFTIVLPDADGTGRGSFTETGNSKTGTIGHPNVGAA